LPTAIPTAIAAAPTPAAPASPLTGFWAFRGETGDRPIGGALRFWMEEGELVGAYMAPSGKATRLANLKLSGNHVAFDIVGPLGAWHLTGTLDGSRMTGTFQTVTRTIAWAAVRQREPGPAPTATPTPTASAR
jgi:hypothetical protein